MKKTALLLIFCLFLTSCASSRIVRGKTPSPREQMPTATPRGSQAIEKLPSGINSTDLPLNVPDGFILSSYANKIDNARVIILDRNNTALVSSPITGKVTAVKDGGQNQKTLLERLNSPHGLALQCEEKCTLFVGETNAVATYDYDPEAVTAANRKIILTLPTSGRHTTKSLQLVTLDNQTRLLTSIGSSCDVCVEKDARRGSILISDLDGQSVKTYASGLRNSVFMTPDSPTGQIWSSEMGRDYLGDELPPDEINIIQQGKNYGWPLCYGKNLHDVDFDKKIDINNPCHEPDFTPSHIDLPAHSAPLGLTFIPDSWPEQYRHNLLVSYHGSWNRTSPTGYKVVRIILTEKGEYQSREDFLTGWLGSNGKAIGRPVGLQFDNKGNLLISDDKLGNI